MPFRTLGPAGISTVSETMCSDQQAALPPAYRTRASYVIARYFSSLPHGQVSLWAAFVSIRWASPQSASFRTGWDEPVPGAVELNEHDPPISPSLGLPRVCPPGGLQWRGGAGRSPGGVLHTSRVTCSSPPISRSSAATRSPPEPDGPSRLACIRTYDRASGGQTSLEVSRWSRASLGPPDPSIRVLEEHTVELGDEAYVRRWGTGLSRFVSGYLLQDGLRIIIGGGDACTMEQTEALLRRASERQARR